MANDIGTTKVIKGGTLIDGLGGEPTLNDSIVIKGNRIQSIGRLPESIAPNGRQDYETINADGKWIIPGLIDAHCHISFGFPEMPTVPTAKGTTSAEFSTIRAARNVQTVLRNGVTSISSPGGTWFIDTAVRDAINAGLLEGPRIYCSGRFIVTYGSIIDREPSWVGTPEHSIGVLANSATEMVTEVRRQCKHGVDFIKIADSAWGDTQTISKNELIEVVGEAHRRNARVAIHSRGAGSTRDAAEAGVDWIFHADLATDSDLEAVAIAGSSIVPTATFLNVAIEAGSDFMPDPKGMDIIKRNFEGTLRVLEKAKSMGIKLMCGTDSGNTSVMEYGRYHAKEAELFVKYGGFNAMEAILAMTSNNAFAVGLENDVGVLEEGKLADLIILDKNPLEDITVLQDVATLGLVIKDGKRLTSDTIQQTDAGSELVFDYVKG